MPFVTFRRHKEYAGGMTWRTATPAMGKRIKDYTLPFLVLYLVLPVATTGIKDGKHQHQPHLCKICTCSYDNSTWMVPTPGDEASYRPFIPDSEALLVNCSGVPVSPFAGGYPWPDVPQHVDDLEGEPDPKVPIVPATRANFASCRLSGGVKKFPPTTLRKLREMSLAHNSFSFVEAGALAGLHSLVLVDLGYNNLSSLPENALPATSDAAMSSRLVDLRLSHNQFEIIPWGAMVRMPKLERLDLSHNLIQSLEGYTSNASNLVFKNLTVLILNHNQLPDFPTAVAARFPQLRVLDLSWNKMDRVIEVLTTSPPSGVGSVVGALQHLKVLHLDGNPIKVLGPNSFAGAPFLHFLSVSETKTLANVSAAAFDGLLLLKTLHLRDNAFLSHLPKEGFLQQVRQNKKWTIKEVDLSYNSLEDIHKDFLPWKEIRLIDLQGNPWNCNCSLQWMLDDLTPYIYTSNSSLLYDLRCAKPARLRGQRFVRWMGHSDGVFCGKKSPPPKPIHHVENEVQEEDELLRGMNTGMLVAIVVLGVALIAVTVAAIVLSKRVKKRERKLKQQKKACEDPLLKKEKSLSKE